jgi:ectoine hydroxylase-related dioxygenase (phytanoyl-CoA dioxygenase family)
VTGVHATAFRRPSPAVVADFERDGFAVLRAAIDDDLRLTLLAAAHRLLASSRTWGRDRGADGKDGFRGVVGIDPAFRPLVANPSVLPTVVALLSPNIHLLSSHLIVLASIPENGPRTIRVPQRPGWHRDMYGVSADLGHAATPRMAIKCAYYLSSVGPDTGTTMFLPGSNHSTAEVAVPPGAIDPPGAVTPALGQCDAVLFENRTWHAGGRNTSATPRVALMLQYGYRWLAPVDDPLPEDSPAPATDVERQLLGVPDRAPDGSLAKGVGAAALRRRWPDWSAARTERDPL